VRWTLFPGEKSNRVIPGGYAGSRWVGQKKLVSAHVELTLSAEKTNTDND